MCNTYLVPSGQILVALIHVWPFYVFDVLFLHLGQGFCLSCCHFSALEDSIATCVNACIMLCLDAIFFSILFFRFSYFESAFIESAFCKISFFVSPSLPFWDIFYPWYYVTLFALKYDDTIGTF